MYFDHTFRFALLLSCSLLTAVLFCSVVAALGILCSLAAPNPQQALLPTIVFPVLMCVGPPLAFLFDEGRQMAWLAGMGIFALAVAVFSHRRWGVAAVAGRFFAIHLVLVTIVSLYAAHPGASSPGRNLNETEVFVMTPGYWTLVPLGDSRYRRPVLGFSDNPSWYDGAGAWYVAMLLYWLALVVNLTWAGWFALRHFDRLAGRTLAQPDAAFTRLARKSTGNAESALSGQG